MFNNSHNESQIFGSTFLYLHATHLLVIPTGDIFWEEIQITLTLPGLFFWPSGAKFTMTYRNSGGSQTYFLSFIDCTFKMYTIQSFAAPQNVGILEFWNRLFPLSFFEINISLQSSKSFFMQYSFWEFLDQVHFNMQKHKLYLFCIIVHPSSGFLSFHLRYDSSRAKFNI